jgi:hypothetical protein
MNSNAIFAPAVDAMKNHSRLAPAQLTRALLHRCRCPFAAKVPFRGNYIRDYWSISQVITCDVSVALGALVKTNEKKVRAVGSSHRQGFLSFVFFAGCDSNDVPVPTDGEFSPVLIDEMV